MTDDVFIVVLVSLTAVGVGAGLLALEKRRSDSILRKWAAENGFELLRSQRCFSSGAFCWVTSMKTSVYLVTVRDRENRDRSGWVRCGSPFAGLFSNQTEVKWKEP